MDFVNIGGCLVGVVMVVCFLLCFIESYLWVYFDIVGIVWKGGVVKGVMGCLVLLFV